MKERFPLMLERPETYSVVSAWSYGLFGFLVIPFLLSFGLTGAWDRFSWRAWTEFAAHAIHFLAAVFIFGKYMVESFLTLQLDFWKHMRAVMIGVLAIILVINGFECLASVLDWEEMQEYCYHAYPVFESECVITANGLLWELPVPGLICLTVFAPVGVSCLFYATGFAPIAERKPRFAYVTIAILLMVPRLFSLALFQPLEQELFLYLLQLPVHWIACRVYQKTDTVWAPILTLALTNLLRCVHILIMFT